MDTDILLKRIFDLFEGIEITPREHGAVDYHFTKSDNEELDEILHLAITQLPLEGPVV